MARFSIGYIGWRGPVRVAYDAGPTGFGLARALAAAEIACVVATLSKLIRAAGDRVKTDARDAAHLTRLLRLGESLRSRFPKQKSRRYVIWCEPAKTPAPI